MQGFYEEYRDDNENFSVSRNGHYSYPPHFHRSLEILIVNKGAHSVVHNGVPYAVQNGDLFFVPATICTPTAFPPAANRTTAC